LMNHYWKAGILKSEITRELAFQTPNKG
jgi:hypothetical protein